MQRLVHKKTSGSKRNTSTCGLNTNRLARRRSGGNDKVVFLPAPAVPIKLRETPAATGKASLAATILWQTCACGGTGSSHTEPALESGAQARGGKQPTCAAIAWIVGAA